MFCITHYRLVFGDRGFVDYTGLHAGDCWNLGHHRNVLVGEPGPTTDLNGLMSNKWVVPAGSLGNTEIHQYFISCKNELGV